MTDHSAVFRECLLNLDVRRAREIWSVAAPHLPQPPDDEAALIAMHAARISMKTIPRRARDYSQAWLAERSRPRVSTGVGISVKAINPAREQQALAIRGAMEYAVMSAVNGGVDLVTEADEVTRRMIIARDKA